MQHHFIARLPIGFDKHGDVIQFFSSINVHEVYFSPQVAFGAELERMQLMIACRDMQPEPPQPSPPTAMSQFAYVKPEVPDTDFPVGYAPACSTATTHTIASALETLGESTVRCQLCHASSSPDDLITHSRGHIDNAQLTGDAVFSEHRRLFVACFPKAVIPQQLFSPIDSSPHPDPPLSTHSATTSKRSRTFSITKQECVSSESDSCDQEREALSAKRVKDYNRNKHECKICSVYIICPEKHAYRTHINKDKTSSQRYYCLECEITFYYDRGMRHAAKKKHTIVDRFKTEKELVDKAHGVFAECFPELANPFQLMPRPSLPAAPSTCHTTTSTSNNTIDSITLSSDDETECISSTRPRRSATKRRYTESVGDDDFEEDETGQFVKCTICCMAMKTTKTLYHLSLKHSCRLQGFDRYKCIDCHFASSSKNNRGKHITRTKGQHRIKDQLHYDPVFTTRMSSLYSECFPSLPLHPDIAAGMRVLRINEKSKKWQ